MPDGDTGVQIGKPLDAYEAGSVFDAYYSEPEQQDSGETPPSREAQSPAPDGEQEAPTDEQDGGTPPEDEGTENQPDDEGESRSEDEDGEESARQPDQPKHKVKVRGVEEEVTLEEALAGYSRTADYTRDKQALAADRKAFDTEKATVTERAQQYHQKLLAVEEALKASNAEPDWDKIRAERPNEYLQLRDAWQIHKDRLAMVASERQQVEQELAKAAQEKRQTALADEGRKLIEKVPEWKDPEKAQKGLQELWDFAKECGYTDQELNSLGDHRTMLLLRDAMLHRNAQRTAAQKNAAADKKIADTKVRPAKPGSSQSTKPKPSARSKSIQQFKKSGKIEDAGRAFEHFFGD